MADQPAKESRETKESNEVKAPAGGGKKKLSMPLLAAIGAVMLIGVGGAVVMMKPKHGNAEGHRGANDVDWLHKAAQEVPWDIGEIRVPNGSKGATERYTVAKFKLLLAKSFKNKLEKEAETALKDEVIDLITEILVSRGPDIKLDISRARELIAEDVMRGLKTGVNPNKPEGKTFSLPFNDGNLIKVYVVDLKDSRW
jgi:hypothetical protein